MWRLRQSDDHERAICGPVQGSETVSPSSWSSDALSVSQNAPGVAELADAPDSPPLDETRSLAQNGTFSLPRCSALYFGLLRPEYSESRINTAFSHDSC